MRAQVSLIPAESKKLIAKAVAGMNEIQNAFKDGIIAIHPSSSTIFIVDELTGALPETEVWVCGIVSPKAACSSAERWNKPVDAEGKSVLHEGPAMFPFTWVIERGKFSTGIHLGELLARMGPGDVYIKGVNAVDPNNNVGVLIGNKKAEGGTIGLVMSQSRRRGFKAIFPVGLEKLIPVPIKQAAEEAAARFSLDYSMGMPCALLPCDGIVVTEPRAIELLTGATATPISAGGLGGAEGALTMVIKGDDEQVTKAISLIESIKGTRLPRQVNIRDCSSCDQERCSIKGTSKSWC